MTSLNAYAQDAERGPNKEYIFTEDAFLELWREHTRLITVEEIYENYVKTERKIALKLIELDTNALELLEKSETKVVRLETDLASQYSVGEVVVFTTAGVLAGTLIGIVTYAILSSSQPNP